MAGRIRAFFAALALAIALPAIGHAASSYVSGLSAISAPNLTDTFYVCPLNGCGLGAVGDRESELQILSLFSASSPLSFNSSTATLSMVSSGVTPGSYTSANITVNATGQITAAANGSGGSGITALTGPVTASGTGSVATTITPTGVTAGSYTSANITVNAAGQVTAAANGSGGSGVAGPGSSVNTDIATWNGTGGNTLADGGILLANLATLSGGHLLATEFPALTGDLTTAAGALATTLATVNSNVGSFTNANITVNAKGLVTAAANGSGGSGTPGGTSGQIQYNNSGAFGGLTPSGGFTIVPSTGVATLGNPGPSTLGGIESLASTAHEWIAAISTAGVPSATQPGFADISGSASAAQMATNLGAAVSTLCSASTTNFVRGDGTCVAPSGGSTTITAAPGLGNSLTSFNGTGAAQTVTNASTLYPQAGTYTVSAAYSLNATTGTTPCTTSVLCDLARTILANGSASIAITAPNPAGTLGAYQIADVAGHGFTVPTVGGTATFFGCVTGSPTTLTVPANYGVQLFDQGSSANTYLCTFQPITQVSGGDVTGPPIGQLMISPGTTGAATGIAEMDGQFAVGASGSWGKRALVAADLPPSAGNTLTDASGTITVPAVTGGGAIDTLVIGGTGRTLGNPASAPTNAVLVFNVIENSTGGYTPAFASNYNVLTGTGGFNTAANASNLVSCLITSTTPWPCIGPTAPQFVTKTANYTVLTADSLTTFDNGGATGTVVFALPAAATGLKYCFVVAASQTLEVLAGASDKIAFGATNTSAVGGNISASAPYSSICVEAPNGVAHQWVSPSSPAGTWTAS